MRSPHDSQPKVNLGDDPDPAAEIGSRLAAASQAAQGLLSNYLFYGQRRSERVDDLQRQAMTRAAAEDAASPRSTASRADRAAPAVWSERAPSGTLGEGADAEPGGRPVPYREAASGTPKLRLMHRRQPWRSADGVAEPTDGSSSDPLAADLPQGDPLKTDPYLSSGASASHAASQFGSTRVGLQ